MKVKQAVASVILMVFLVSCLTGCIIIPLRKNFDIPPDTVSSIEVYDLRQANNQRNWLENGTPAYTLPESDHADFLQALSEITFRDAIIIILAATDPSFQYDDWTLRINYTNGSYEFLSSDGYGEVFDSSGERIDSHHWSCDQEAWDELIGKYVPESIYGSHPAD